MLNFTFNLGHYKHCLCPLLVLVAGLIARTLSYQLAGISKKGTPEGLGDHQE